ncbi:NAD-dependent succinate-semialdehyde dehydrogenase [Phenylobacterium sp.]|uniref:NAD-dependent succinate-semialdehyde dehydrogenase n=1 Tax=Phenylobacterium sp. TaxID=1871053 RepID=UPI00301B9540
MTFTLNDSGLLRFENRIGGRWAPAGAASIAVVNPATGEEIGRVPRFGAAETRQAIEAAAAAFPGWRALPAGERAAILRRLSALLVEHVEDLALILSSEQGKSLAEARGEIRGAAAYVQWFAEEGRRAYGDVIPSPWADRRVLTTREPVGVVAAITPWNFPSSMIARKLGAALAAGCTLVVKPASQTPLSALVWGELCQRAGVPDGIFNCVTGSASEIGAELTSHPAVRKVTFTGSTSVGKALMAQSSSTMKKISMELGGNAPFIVFADADLDRAVGGAIDSKFRNSGQTCVCANRLLVHDAVYDAFTERLADAVSALKVGPGTEPGVQQGPLIDEAAVRKVEEHVADAVARGARVISGGARHPLGRTFFQPTVIVDVPPDAQVSREETFGPLAPVFRFRDDDEAVRMANDTEFGLACYFYTRDLGRAFRVAEQLEYGIVAVNEGLVTTEVAPFGGVKESGMGREGARSGLADYMVEKYVCLGL